MINPFQPFQRGRLRSLWIFLVFISGILTSCSNEIEGEVFEEDKAYNLEIPTYFPALAFDTEKIQLQLMVLRWERNYFMKENYPEIIQFPVDFVTFRNMLSRITDIR